MRVGSQKCGVALKRERALEVGTLREPVSIIPVKHQELWMNDWLKGRTLWSIGSLRFRF